METNGIFDDIFDLMIEDAKIQKMNELHLPLELLEDYSDRKHEVTAEELERRYEKIRRKSLPSLVL